MSYENADFYVKDNKPSASPIAGVVVRVFSTDGKLFYTESTTDDAGHVGFLLDSANQYQVRFYKFQVSFTNPYLFNLVPGQNIFDIVGITLVPPVATDARLCRCSGFFRRATGAPASNVDIHFIAKFSPLLLDGAAVLTERDINRTDSTGYMQIDLIRLGKYDVTVQGMEGIYRSITVPDQPGVNLPDLLFPVVDQVILSPVGPYTVVVGTDFPVDVMVTATDGELLPGTAAQDVYWNTDDPSICAVLDDGVKLILRAFRSGTTNLTAARRDRTIIRYPDVGIAGQPVSIVVP